MKARIGLVSLMLIALARLAAAQEPQLIPRRIHVAADTAQVAEGAPHLAGAADDVYAAVAARTPLVRVEDRALAHARLEVSVRPDGDAYRLAAALGVGERPAVTREAVVARGARGFAGYAAFVRETGEAFAPLLPMVRPQVVLGDASQEARYRTVAGETDFATELARRWELSLWGSGLTELYHEPMIEDPDQIEIRTVPLLPLYVDAAWYYSRNGGLLASLFFDYGEFIGLGVIYDGSGERIDKAVSTNLFLLPGLGITYRTLARISAQFSAVFYLGPVHVSAEDPIEGIAEAGEDVWTYTSMMLLSSGVAWNIDLHWSVKARVSVGIDMMSTFLDRLSDRSGYAPVMLQFFTLGFAWRP